MKFRSQVGVYAAADLLGLSIGFISSLVVTRLLTPEQYGAIPLLMAVWAVPAVFRFAGMDYSLPFQLALAEHAGETGRRRVLVTSTIVATSGCVTIWVLFGLATLATPWASEYAGVSSLELAVFVCGLGPLVVAEWYRIVFRFQQQSRYFAELSLLPRLAYAGAIPVMFLVERPERLLVLLAAVTIGHCMGGGWGLSRLRAIGPRPYGTRYFSRPLARRMIAEGLALAPAGALYGIHAMSDRLLVGWIVGPREVAVLVVARMLGSLLLLPKAWLTLAWQPLLVDVVSTGKPDIYIPVLQNAVLPIAAVFGGLTLVATALAEPFMSIVYPTAYGPAAQILPFLALSIAVSSLAMVGMATVYVDEARRHLIYASIFGAALVVNIAVGLALIPRYGATGAVLGSLAAEGLITGLWIVIGAGIRRNVPINWAPTMLLLAGVVGLTLAHRFGAQALIQPLWASGFLLLVGMLLIWRGLPYLLRIEAAEVREAL